MQDDGRVHCNRCGRETRHGVRASYSRSSQDYVEPADAEFEERETVDILECQGCEHLVVRRLLQHEVYGEATEFYPPPISRPMPRWKMKIPATIGALLEEVYRALQADSPRLATMGARTILDLVIVEQVGDRGNFPQKLEELEKRGFVGGMNREFLAAALDAGSAVAHRGLAPSSPQLHHVMDIVENLLETAYVLPEAADTLKKTTPPRKPRAT